MESESFVEKERKASTVMDSWDSKNESEIPCVQILGVSVNWAKTPFDFSWLIHINIVFFSLEILGIFDTSKKSGPFQNKNLFNYGQPTHFEYP